MVRNFIHCMIHFLLFPIQCRCEDNFWTYYKKQVLITTDLIIFTDDSLGLRWQFRKTWCWCWASNEIPPPTGKAVWLRSIHHHQQVICQIWDSSSSVRQPAEDTWPFICPSGSLAPSWLSLWLACWDIHYGVLKGFGKEWWHNYLVKKLLFRRCSIVC